MLRANPITQSTFDRHAGGGGSARDHHRHHHQQYPLNSTEHRPSAAVDDSGASAFEELQREAGDMGSLLKTGRIEAIVHGLWQKMVSFATFDGL